MSDIQKRQQKVNDLLEKAYQKIAVFKEKQQDIESRLNDLLQNNPQYVVLSEVVEQLDRLTELGGEKLFWGDGLDERGTKSHLERVHGLVSSFESKVEKLRQERDQALHKVLVTANNVEELEEQVLVLAEVAEEARNEFVIEREFVISEYRPLVMPWSIQGEDEKRFRKILLITLLISILLGYLVPLWDIPKPERIAKVEVPERLAKLLLEKKPPPPPPPPVEEEKPKDEEKPKEKEKEKPKEKVKEKPRKEKTKVASKKVSGSGLLAFKNDFANLLDTSVDKKLGAQARFTNKGRAAKRSTRSIITTQAGAGTGGINTASLSRNVAGTAGKGIKGAAAFSRIESSIGSAYDGDERPLSDGPGPSRTDEEIQIVFDKYKATLYRIYNRELRKNPTLQGKIVLRLTIQPNGKVSACSIDSSDMDAPSLDKKMVARVKKFNFGAKEGVSAITILYPIDFLPAS